MEEAHIIREIRRHEYLAAYLRAYLSPGLFEMDTTVFMDMVVLLHVCSKLVKRNALRVVSNMSLLKATDYASFMDIIETEL